jgi:tetratricopeptide (TPR) repeat protein
MQAAHVAALSIALALGTSVATATFLNQSDSGSASGAAAMAALNDEIETLRRECAELRRQLESRPLRESKRELASLGEQQIEAAIRAWLEKHGQGLLADATATKQPKNIDEKQAFLTLVDLDVPYDQRAKVWAQVQKAGKLDALLKRLRDHAKNAPNDADAQTALGHALVQKINSPGIGGMEQAVLGAQIDKAYGKALEIDPEHWEARYSRAIGLTFWPAFLGKQAEAIQNFETLIDQQERRTPERKFASTYILLGNVYAQQGKMDKAKEVWQRGLKQFPNDKDLQGKLK